MTYDFYRMLHITGMLMLFAGLVGLWGTRVADGAVSRPREVRLALVHGFGMFLVLASGMVLLKRLDLLSAPPMWSVVKMVIWLLLGGSMVLAKRKAHWGLGLVGLWIFLGAVAAGLAFYKP